MELMEIRFSAEENKNFVDTIVENNARLAMAAAYKKFNFNGMIEKVEIPEGYEVLNKQVKEAILGFAAKKAGLNVPKDSTDLAIAFSSTVFRDVMNTITSRTLSLMMVRYTSSQLELLADIENVKAGESKTYEIETKSLPIAQRGTYVSNAALVPSFAKGSVTVSPKVYTIGTSLDYIRILANDYDWGMAVARVYAGMLYAQYKLCASVLYDTSALSGTPLLQTSFTSPTYTQLADDIAMLNGGTRESVTAYGTRVAFNALSALATAGGFSAKDEYIRSGYINKIYGVDSVIIEQITNFASPFTNATAASLRAIPNNIVALIGSNGDKPIKLVRENYVRVLETEANNNTLNRMEYIFNQAFDAKLATASHYGLQQTNA